MLYHTGTLLSRKTNVKFDGFSCSVKVPDRAWRGAADFCTFLLPVKRWTQNWLWKKRMTYGLCTSPLYLDVLGVFFPSCERKSCTLCDAFIVLLIAEIHSMRRNGVVEQHRWFCGRLTALGKTTILCPSNPENKTRASTCWWRSCRFIPTAPMMSVVQTLTRRPPIFPVTWTVAGCMSKLGTLRHNTHISYHIKIF